MLNSIFGAAKSAAPKNRQLRVFHKLRVGE
jgi:hypothetical protein